MGYYTEQDRKANPGVGVGFGIMAVGAILLFILAFAAGILLIILSTLMVVALIGFKWGAQKYKFKRIAMSGMAGALVTLFLFTLTIMFIPLFMEYGIGYAFFNESQKGFDWLIPFTSDYFQMGINPAYYLGLSSISSDSDSYLMGLFLKTDPLLSFLDGLLYAVFIYLIVYWISLIKNKEANQFDIKRFLGVTKHFKDIRSGIYSKTNPIIELFNGLTGWFRGILVFMLIIAISALLTQAFFYLQLFQDEDLGLMVLSYVCFVLNALLSIILFRRALRFISKKRSHFPRLFIYHLSVVLPFYLINGIVNDYFEFDSPFEHEISFGGLVLVLIVTINFLGFISVKQLERVSLRSTTT